MRDLLITVPHHSGVVPEDVLRAMLGDAADDPDARAALLRRVWLEGDPHTDTIFALPGARVLLAETSRFVVDLNRGRDEGGPNGVVKATDFSGRPLYPPGAAPSPDAVLARLRAHYDPFHARVEAALGEARPLLLVDGHSMTPEGPALSPDGGGARRPAASLITGGGPDGEPVEGPVSLPGDAARALARALRDALREALPATVQGRDVVTLNRPFDRGEIQRRYGDPGHPARTPAVAIELNRALFEDASGSALPGRCDALRRALVRALHAARPELERAAAGRRA